MYVYIYIYIFFKYSNTIRAKETNYKETVNNVNRNVTCACKDYQKFINNRHGHVITGYLNIIHNIEIRKLLAEGLNFRGKTTTECYKSCTICHRHLHWKYKQCNKKSNEIVFTMENICVG